MEGGIARMEFMVVADVGLKVWAVGAEEQRCQLGLFCRKVQEEQSGLIINP